ncbi:MAG TPA: DUF2846 domain-containing protein [Cellvibrionaceae bacterium]|nr:DUF2846 domain-containing protein [Cellvibrionaceae bacterium]
MSPTPALTRLRAEPNDTCPLWIYRNKTTFQMLNPELPHVYVNELRVGTLSIGQSYCLYLSPGRYEISIKEPFLFMPTYTSGSKVVDIVAGTTLYLRYKKDPGGVESTGVGVVVTSKQNLDWVAKQDWENRS